MKYTPVIGLEIHAELLTETKVFCACKNSFGGSVNERVCPVCSAMPGTLPTINKKAILLAARAGATYVSPFLGRLDDINCDGMQLIDDIVTIFDTHGIDTEIIAASIRNPLHVTEAAKLGAHIATVPYKVIMQMIKHPLTDAGIEKFLKDWEGHIGK